MQYVYSLKNFRLPTRTSTEANCGGKFEKVEEERKKMWTNTKGRPQKIMTKQNRKIKVMYYIN